MARLFVQYLAIYNHVKGRIKFRNFQSMLEILPSTK